MRDDRNWTTYSDRLERVTAHIYAHLDDDIDLDKLAEVACLSTYHWHRIYHAVHGETIAQTVKRLRLHRAAGLLAQTSLPIAEIAERSGYPNLQSFTRIFRAAYGMPPAQYRRHGTHSHFQKSPEEVSAMHEITITTVPTLKAVSIAHVGSYMEIGQAFDRLFGWLGPRQLIRPGMRMLGVYLDDPSVVPESQLRSRACVVSGTAVAVEPPVEMTEIAGGSYAVLRHKGPYATMKSAYQWLYGDWLVNSGREAADAPCFEDYLNSPRDTAPAELLTDIYLPLRETS
ncbi:AraC family transcriptional regulator [Phreatobacter stygius]|uniref:Helix-turn-helix domain-containing protein n=1 Tax=Phreatobacter stygius TaxID=1940610 RepID=A0A4D7AXF4_9HYPH|nr:GyrI-like domain-containing protein [Phreatobacter stygius]QCI63488.1 helix-turn-helix domain-containing protein [Phreatobacter stygius]